MGSGLRQFNGIRCLAKSADTYWELQRNKASIVKLRHSVVASLRAKMPNIKDVDLEIAIREKFHANYPDIDVYTRFLKNDKPALLITERGQKIPRNWWDIPGDLIGDHLTTTLPWTETDDGTIGDFDGVTTSGAGAFTANNVSPVKDSVYSYQSHYGTNAAAYGYLTFENKIDIVWINSYVYFCNLPTDGSALSFFMWSQNLATLLQVSDDGSLIFNNDHGSYDTGYNVSVDTWYWISALCECDSGDHYFQLYVNNNEEYPRTLKTTDVSESTGIVRIGMTYAYNNSGDWYFDQCNVQEVRKLRPIIGQGDLSTEGEVLFFT